MFHILYCYILISILVSTCYSLRLPFYSEQSGAVEETISPLSDLFSSLFEVEFSEEEEEGNGDIDLNNLYLTIGLESGKKSTTTTTEEPTTVKTKRTTTKKYHGK